MSERTLQPPQNALSGSPERLLVEFEDNDPADPKSWSPVYKASLTFLMGMLALTGSLGSSIISPADDKIAEVMCVSREATILCISLYMWA